ncbi:response regulator [Runella slithyformis]|uniref:Response regulator receiver protein n=1 Tax=Runella slithyformis (strain ATCC 29530 / DSM 19594 / LMG 11500 / NCIMB 11436 / LSU 4) TaxID=761193 RepID=A0A7U4E826_RUNSL|nr:response regulator [Runella slithyformis]AEI50923.1 response regulator receiver protein [Runella slithyformis DSM 19594]
MTLNSKSGKSIFLADDDADDCLLFEDALREVSQQIKLTTANDGIELMDILDRKVPPPPDVIFLDLNMPRKNGFECLIEIKHTDKLKNIPVVIFSTSSQPETINRVYEQGANYYVCKPGSFSKLKLVIQKVLDIDWNQHKPPRNKENFLITL